MTLDLATRSSRCAPGTCGARCLPAARGRPAPAYRAPNDRVLELGGRVGRPARAARPARPDREPIDEARRCLALGARGISCTRAPSASRSTTPARAGVRAGRGAAPAGVHPRRPRHAADRRTWPRSRERHPGSILILAHAGSSTRSASATSSPASPNVFFDTSTWGVSDLLNLLSASRRSRCCGRPTSPYGNISRRLTLIGSILDEVGASDEIRRGVFGGTLEGIVNGQAPAMTDPIAPRTWELPHAAQRVYTYLRAAIPLIWMRLPDHVGVSGLAAGACRGEGGRPLEELITTACRVWDDVARGADPRRRVGRREAVPALPDRLFLSQCCPEVLPVRVTLSVNGERHELELAPLGPARRRAARRSRTRRHEDRLRRGCLRRLRRAARRPVVNSCLSTRQRPRATSWRRSRASRATG